MARKSTARRRLPDNANSNPGIGRNKYTVAQKRAEVADDLSHVVYIPPSQRQPYLTDEDVIDDYTKPIDPFPDGALRPNQLRGSEFYLGENAPALPAQPRTGRKPIVSHWAETSVIDDGRGRATPTFAAKAEVGLDRLKDKLCKKKPKRQKRGQGAGRNFVPWCKK